MMQSIFPILFETGALMGFIALCYQNDESPYTPHVDLGWWLITNIWGRGLAMEGVKACLDFTFSDMGLSCIYPTTVSINTSFNRILQKIGMEKVTTFEHLSTCTARLFNEVCRKKMKL